MNEQEQLKIIQGLYELGRQLFPAETAKVEQFVIEQAKAYGIAYAQQQLELVKANPLTPALLVIGGLLLFKLLRR